MRSVYLQFLEEGRNYLYNQKLYRAAEFYLSLCFLSSDLTREEQLEAVLLRGMAKDAQGRFEEACEDFNLILEERPNNCEALVERGRCYVKQALYEKAQADFREVLSQYEALGDVASFQDEYSKIQQDYSVVSKLLLTQNLQKKQQKNLKINQQQHQFVDVQVSTQSLFNNKTSNRIDRPSPRCMNTREKGLSTRNA